MATIESSRRVAGSQAVAKSAGVLLPRTRLVRSPLPPVYPSRDTSRAAVMNPPAFSPSEPFTRDFPAAETSDAARDS